MLDTVSKTLPLFAAQTVTANATGNRVDTALPYANEQTGARGALAGRAIIGLVATAVGGTSPTFDPVVEGSWDGTNFVTLPVVNEAGAVTAWTQVTSTASTQTQVRYLPGPLPPFLRGRVTVGGTSPTASLNLHVQATNQR